MNAKRIEVTYQDINTKIIYCIMFALIINSVVIAVALLIYGEIERATVFIITTVLQSILFSILILVLKKEVLNGSIRQVGIKE